MLTLRNPHAVLAAIKFRPKSVREVSLSPDQMRNPSGPWEKVARLAAANQIRVHSKKPNPDQRGSAGEAQVEPRQALSVEELFSAAPEEKLNRGIYLALDCVQDPHNVGAIFRSAAFFGVKGILMTEERSAQLSSTVYDVSAGGVEALPFAIETNLVRALGIAKDQGVWTLGTSEHASESLFKIKSDRAWLVVFGNEEKGIRRLTEENCDLLCTIRCAKNSEVGSLNVSVAVASTLTHFLSGGLQ